MYCLQFKNNRHWWDFYPNYKYCSNSVLFKLAEIDEMGYWNVYLFLLLLFGNLGIPAMNFNLCSCVAMCVSASQETVASVGACALQSESWHLKESVPGTWLLFLFMLTRPYSSALLDMTRAGSCSLAGFQLTNFCTKSTRNNTNCFSSCLLIGNF